MSNSEKPRSRRAWIVTAIIAAAALITAAVVPLAANAVTVALTGTVANNANAKLAGVAVSAYDDSGSLGSLVGSTTTSSSGTFSFAALAAGSYTLHFGATSSTYAQYLGDTTDSTEAQTLTLTAGGGNHSYINAVLAGSGTIAGSVKTTSKVALKGYTVRAYPDGGDESTPVDSATTSSTGAYSLTGLVPGSYRLEAIDTAAGAPYAPAFSGGGTTIDNATGVGAVAGTMTPYSFSLGKSGAISGHVTGQTVSSSEVLAGVKIIPYLLQGTSPSFFNETSAGLPTTVTSSTGAYTLSGLAPGYYTLDFVPGTSPIGASHSVYGRTFLGNQYLWTSATVVHVTSGATTPNENVELQAGGTVTITIYDYDDFNAIPQVLTPLSNILVTIDHAGSNVDQPSDDNQSAITDANGQVTFTGLGQGDWETIMGSNSTDGGTLDDTYQREVSDVSVNSGSEVDASVTMQKKVAGGLQPTTDPVISNQSSPPTVGDSLSVTDGTWNSPVDTTTFQWLRNGVPIAGATNQSYLVQGGDLNDDISVAVTANSFAYGAATYITAAVGPENPASLVNYSYPIYLIGGLGVGETLSVYTSPWTISSVAFTYQWQYSTNQSTWTNIGGANGITHQLTASDLADGPYLRVSWTATREGYVTDSGSTPDLQVFKNTFSASPAPKLATTSSAYSIVDGTWSPNIGATTVTWTVYHSNGTTSQSVGFSLLRSGLAGDYVTVAITRDATGMYENADYSFTAQTGTVAVTTAPTVTGTAEVGKTLTSTAATFAPTLGAVTEQWQHEVGTTWKSISGATAASYVVQSTDVGYAIRVEYSGSLNGYTSPLTNSTATAKTVMAPAPTQGLDPIVSGTAGTTLTVTAFPGTWSTAPTSFKYQWRYSSTSSPSGPFTNISGATSQSYVIPTSLAGKYLSFVVTPVLAGYASTSATSASYLIGTDYLQVVTNPTVTRSGSTLTASGAKFTPAATTTTYTWYTYNANDTSFSQIATGPSYTVSPTYANYHLVVVATGTASGYNATNGPQVLAQKATIVPSGTLTISGTQVGTTLSLSGLSLAPVLAYTTTYAWQYLSGSTWKTISGAAAATYVPAATYSGHQVRAEQTSARTDFNTLTSVSTPVTITPGEAPSVGTGSAAPSFTTNAAFGVGATLTVNPGTWSTTSGISFTYQWQVSSDDEVTWANISGATGKSYTLPASDYAVDVVGVVITATVAGYQQGTYLLAAPHDVGVGTPVQTSAPKITKSASGAYTVTSGGLSPAPQNMDYVWSHYDPSTDSWVIDSQTPSAPYPSSSSFTPDVSIAGDPVRVEVSGEYGADYNDSDWIGIARTGSPITVDPTTLSVTGTPWIGDTLTANWSTFSVPNPTVTVQWYRGATAIAGATGPTYGPVTADVGQTITAKLTVAKTGYANAVFTAGSFLALSDVNLEPNDPEILGTTQVDDPLTAGNMIFPVSGTTATYQWYLDYTAIPGATSATYTPPASDVGQELTVEYTLTKPNYVALSSFIPEVIVTQGAPLANKSATPVVISGNPEWGSTLTGVVGAWNYPATVTYQWQYEVPGGSTWQTVVGAGASTYTPSAADGLMPGSTIRLTVAASRPGHASDTEVSPYFYMQP